MSKNGATSQKTIFPHKILELKRGYLFVFLSSFFESCTIEIAVPSSTECFFSDFFEHVLGASVCVPKCAQKNLKKKHLAEESTAISMVQLSEKDDKKTKRYPLFSSRILCGKMAFWLVAPFSDMAPIFDTRSSKPRNERRNE